MKKLICSLLCSAAFAVASPLTVSTVNTGSPVERDFFGEKVGPYTLNIAGSQVSAMSLFDFTSDPGSFKADVTVLSNNNLSDTNLGNRTYHVDGARLTSNEVYDVEAFLFSEMLKPNADRAGLQDAAWDFMDEVTGRINLEYDFFPTVNNDINYALANYNSIDAGLFEIVTPTGAGCDPAQEFIVATPEPASLGLFGAALLALGIFGTRSRMRKATTSVNA